MGDVLAFERILRARGAAVVAALALAGAPGLGPLTGVALGAQATAPGDDEPPADPGTGPGQQVPTTPVTQIPTVPVQPPSSEPPPGAIVDDEGDEPVPTPAAPPPIAAVPAPAPAAPVTPPQPADTTPVPVSDPPTAPVPVPTEDPPALPQPKGESPDAHPKVRSDPATKPTRVPLVVQTADKTTTAPSPARPATGSAPAPRIPEGAKTHVVRPGESLWSIAKATLPSGASDAQIARLVARLWALNSERIGTGDPSMLPVGVELKLA